MLAVIELAQILAGALDDKFNIINKSAIVQVVTCLEAFSITYESYREVQNTRIIKDLQALRQNKGNDQALAKRIKNLLRKWKEHLASSAQPTASQSSQPNSPQNMSQGSSDTQFMTQHSQSPPISQLRMVNGPTSFTNLLPKSHLSATRPITSPITPFPLQNGNQDTSRLGKRKLEIDENENHNRRKVMKESSPVKPFSLPNNSFIANIASSMVPIVPAVQLSPPVQPLSVPIQAKVEPPKKRGRKKGSKGIDSTLNGAMPDFQAEIQQKIALSAGKRNKTTLELQQMLELNQNSAMSWTNGDTDSVDRGSNHTIQHNHNHLSQASHLSRLNDHNKASFNNVTIKKERGESNDAKKLRVNNDVLVPTSSTAGSLVSATSNAEEEIARIRSLFPPIDYEAAARDVFDDYNNIDEYGDYVVCTCESREVISYQDDETVDEKLALPAPVIDEVVKNGSNGKVVEESDDDETDDFCAVDEVDDVMLKSPPAQGAVKSIFDPEYDANENLIEEMMVRRKPNATKVIEVKVEKEAVKSARIQPITEAFPNQENNERVPIINYVCDEDPMCAARAFFQRDHVQRGQVEALHNSCMSCVNGNWNGIPTEPPQQDYAEDNEQINYEKHQIWKRVVPKYDFLTCDRIPKTLNDGSPFSIPPPPNGDVAERAGCEVKIEPFDGLKKSKSDIEFREWHECMNVRSYNDEVLTILPYVIID